MHLTKFDKQLLNLIQTGLPLETAPFAIIAGKLGCGEQAVIERLAVLRENGLIRRFGAFFDAESLGYLGRLVAVRVEAQRLPAVAAVINSWPQVTHNDERDHEFNLWFTVQSRDDAEIESLIQAVADMEGVSEVISMPTTNRCKINLEFHLK